MLIVVTQELAPIDTPSVHILPQFPKQEKRDRETHIVSSRLSPGNDTAHFCSQMIG